MTSQITCDVTAALLKYGKYIEKLKLAVQAMYVQITMICTVYICVNKMNGGLYYIKDLKNIKKVGMACQKVCKQGRDDIIVKVNLQSLIPALFSH